MISVRAVLRRAVRPLPAGAQVALRALRERATGTFDSAPAIAALRAREQALIDGHVATQAAQPGRLRILASVLQQSPPWLDTTYGLATALRLRGHDVRTLLCDGPLPRCEMTLGSQEPPPCEVCAAWLSRYEDAYGFVGTRLSSLLDADDRAWAREMARGRATAGDARATTPLMVDGVDLEQLARRELQRYRRGFAFEPLADEAYEPWLMSALLVMRAAGRVVERTAPDVLVVSSGRTLVAACLVAASRARGVRVVTWDTEPSFADGLVFSHDLPAVQVPLDAAWQEVRDRSLATEQRRDLHAFLGRWSRSDGTPFPYNPAPVTGADEIRTVLGLRPGARVISAFSNSAWDMAVVDRDVGFVHMFDWLFALVDYARQHPETDVVIRAHPAEVKVPDDLKSRTPVCDELRARCAPLPPNVKLVDGHSPLSSYTLAALSDVVMVYSSRLGLELAIAGRQVWLAGDVTYRGKGFTRDLRSKDEMWQALDAGDVSGPLDADEVARAEQFAWLWFFRGVIRSPLLRPADGRFVLDSFAQLAVGGDSTVDRLCHAIAVGAPFVAP